MIPSTEITCVHKEDWAAWLMFALSTARAMQAFSRHGGVGLTVGLDDLRRLFQT